MSDHTVEQIQQITQLITLNTKVFVLSGAGCSTASGLGDYRDSQGKWKRPQPITGNVFCNDTVGRHRYWARSFVGWPAFKQATPNLPHKALTRLEAAGIVKSLVTQNVDELHQQAGHQRVIDLHGVLSSVSCISCAHKQSRDHFQQRLAKNNAWLTGLNASYAPDGDADLETDDALSEHLKSMQIPPCPKCGNLMKPDVVFFGENVPKQRVENAMAQLRAADVLLVTGSSLMVYSGFRFCRDAHQRGQPIIIFNNGVTRADDIATLVVAGDCGEKLNALAIELMA
ncbi:UNVERIFIED_CONTAM: hypothetical protein GTU68_053993 [Idotea baltica]|nr:hypothetical protein [Idotea baltica]